MRRISILSYYGFPLRGDGRALTSAAPGDLSVVPLCITIQKGAKRLGWQLLMVETSPPL